jgi:RNA polymerase sigma-70 factor (ECF subfamily)
MTWAYKFVVFEVSSKLGRHSWLRRTAALEPEHWERLPDTFGLDPADRAQWGELIDRLRRAVEEDLSERQRRVFVALVLNGLSPDALAVELQTNPNAIYKTVFDVRQKLRSAFVADGYLSVDG